MQETKWWKMRYLNKSDLVLRTEGTVIQLRQDNEAAKAQIERLLGELREAQEELDGFTSRAEEERFVLLFKISALNDELKIVSKDADSHHVHLVQEQADSARLWNDIEELEKALVEVNDACDEAED
ncbi:hypothetical protein P171DRAFT_491227 [Karstenula rhodostoma CBS 690.94]|uniref:Uncharacterized protein n=1 Tax=Karstenula rhodostoma CBS 690.94 TaxID=1392251 RepID=A0A9P4P8M7_9PLEO|nr:hypothetical protein P171DRAFT_491227 [Karstenula rhodostoma CBS 690.94]